MAKLSTKNTPAKGEKLEPEAKAAAEAKAAGAPLPRTEEDKGSHAPTVRVRMLETAGPWKKGNQYDLDEALAHHYCEVAKVAELA
jgi:hypothetical protein